MHRPKQTGHTYKLIQGPNTKSKLEHIFQRVARERAADLLREGNKPYMVNTGSELQIMTMGREILYILLFILPLNSSEATLHEGNG